jgi:Fic-DOC domain mobile mystery protein B
MGLNLSYNGDASILSEEEKDGLKIKGITNHAELDEFEQKNIEKAHIWLLGKKIDKETILSEKFIKTLHYQMFGSVWSWAGHFRKSDKNIGATPWHQIPVAVSYLFQNVNYWLINKTFSGEEVAVRFHHGLVLIHPFPNGNGRLCRLLTDLMLERVFQKPLFSWGDDNLRSDNDNRKEYIAALHEADDGSFERLIRFVR